MSEFADCCMLFGVALVGLASIAGIAWLAGEHLARRPNLKDLLGEEDEPPALG